MVVYGGMWWYVAVCDVLFVIVLCDTNVESGLHRAPHSM